MSKPLGLIPGDFWSNNNCKLRILINNELREVHHHYFRNIFKFSPLIFSTLKFGVFFSNSDFFTFPFRFRFSLCYFWPDQANSPGTHYGQIFFKKLILLNSLWFKKRHLLFIKTKNAQQLLFRDTNLPLVKCLTSSVPSSFVNFVIRE